MQLCAVPHNEAEEEVITKKSKCKKKCVYQAPEYIIIFHDLSIEQKSQSLSTLLKKNRHFETKLLISSQWVHDLLPESRKQLDLFMVFKGFPDAKLGEIYKDCDSAIPFETFCKICKKATKHPFSFMYMNPRSDSYRKNCSEQFILH